MSAALPIWMDAITDPDFWLVARVQNGDRHAFEELMAAHGRRLFNTLVVVIGDSEQARDAMQDTFLKAFQNIDCFRGQAKFSTWLTSIAINTALQGLRSQRRLQPFNDSWDEAEVRPRILRLRDPDPEELCSMAERRRLLKLAVTRVPLKYRAVLVLRDIEHFSTDETARTLGLEVPTVKARLLRARIMLRRSLLRHFS